MSRMVGTVSRGLRAPIIRAGDDLHAAGEIAIFDVPVHIKPPAAVPA